MAEDDQEQIAKYEAWVAKLEANIVEMARQRRWSWAYLVGGVIVGGVVWRFHHFVAGSIVTLGIILWITAIYITYMRTWYYRNELTRTRWELDRIATNKAKASAKAKASEPLQAGDSA